MDLINTPMPRVSCRNDENLENKADQFVAFLPKNFGKIFSGFLSFGQLTLGMGVFIRSMASPDCKDL